MQNAPAVSAQRMMSRQSPYGGFGVVGQDMSGNKKPSTDPINYGGSLNFNGTTQSLRILSPSSYLREWYSGSFTCEYWVYPTAFTNEPNGASVVIGNVTQAVSGNYWTFGPLTGGIVMFYYWSGVINKIQTTATIPLNTWTHLAVVFNATTNIITIYINGVSSASAAKAAGATSDPSIEFCIGRAYTAYFAGRLSNIRITRSAVYTKNFTPPTSPLPVLDSTTLLLSAPEQLNFLEDSSPYDHRFTNQDQVTRSPDTPFYTPTGSMAFQSPGSQAINLPNSSAAAFGTGDFTVEAWVYLSATMSGIFTIFSVGGAAAGSYGFYWDATTQKIDAVRYGDAALSGRTTNTYPTGRWYHVANSRVAGTSRVFINGVLDAGATYAMGSVTATTALTLGGGWAAPVNNGFISGLRVVLGTGLYTTNFLPSTQPPTAITNTTILLNSSTPATLLTDSSTNNYAVTNANGVAQSSFVPYVTQPIPTGSLNFNTGLANYYTFTSPAMPGDFTIEAWVFLKAGGGGGGNVIMGNAPAAFDWWINATGTVMFYIAGTVLQTTTTVPFNAWTHVATTRSGTTVKTYINGVANPATGTTAASIASASLFIGRDDGSSGAFSGFITNLRMTVGTVVYTSNFLPSLTPLPALSTTSFLLSTPTDATSAVDFSTSKRALTKVGAPTWTNATPFPVQY